MGLFGTTTGDIRKWEKQEQTDKLKTALTHKEPKIKEMASKSLCNLVIKWQALGQVNKIAEAVSIENEDIKKTAIDSLGNYRILEAANLFINQLADPRLYIRKAACNALVKLGPPVESYLLAAWNELDKAITQGPYQNLIVAPGTEAFHKLQDHYLNYFRPMREAMIDITLSLGRSNLKIIFLALDKQILLSHDQDELLRIYAIQSVGNSEYFSFIDRFSYDLKKETNWQAKSALDTAISKLSSRRCLKENIPVANLHEEVFKQVLQTKKVEELTRVLYLISNQYQMTSIIDKLAGMRSRDSVDTLIVMLAYKNWEVRARSAHALGEIGDQRAVDGLIGLISGSPGAEINQVIIALGKLKDPRAAEPLVSLLSSGNDNLTTLIVEALISLGQFDSLSSVMLNSRNVRKKIQIARSIGKQDEKAADVLKNLFYDHSQETDIFVPAAEALAYLGKTDNDIIASLQMKLQVGSRSQRESVAHCLIAIAKLDFEAIRQYWQSIKSYISNNRHTDTRSYQYGDCPSDSGVHTDAGIFSTNVATF